MRWKILLGTVGLLWDREEGIKVGPKKIETKLTASGIVYVANERWPSYSPFFPPGTLFFKRSASRSFTGLPLGAALGY